eukprot:gene25931-11610_t
MRILVQGREKGDGTDITSTTVIDHAFRPHGTGHGHGLGREVVPAPYSPTDKAEGGGSLQRSSPTSSERLTAPWSSRAAFPQGLPPPSSESNAPDDAAATDASEEGGRWALSRGGPKPEDPTASLRSSESELDLSQEENGQVQIPTYYPSPSYPRSSSAMRLLIQGGERGDGTGDTTSTTVIDHAFRPHGTGHGLGALGREVVPAPYSPTDKAGGGDVSPERSSPTSSERLTAPWASREAFPQGSPPPSDESKPPGNAAATAASDEAGMWGWSRDGPKPEAKVDPEDEEEKYEEAMEGGDVWQAYNPERHCSGASRSSFDYIKGDGSRRVVVTPKTGAVGQLPSKKQNWSKGVQPAAAATADDGQIWRVLQAKRPADEVLILSPSQGERLVSKRRDTGDQILTLDSNNALGPSPAPPTMLDTSIDTPPAPRFISAFGPEAAPSISLDEPLGGDKNSPGGKRLVYKPVTAAAAPSQRPFTTAPVKGEKIPQKKDWAHSNTAAIPGKTRGLADSSSKTPATYKSPYAGRQLLTATHKSTKTPGGGNASPAVPNYQRPTGGWLTNKGGSEASTADKAKQTGAGAKQRMSHISAGSWDGEDEEIEDEASAGEMTHFPKAAGREALRLAAQVRATPMQMSPHIKIEEEILVTGGGSASIFGLSNPTSLDVDTSIANGKLLPKSKT